jgi:LysW-gamma-L-lysine carboxypeptidase
MEVDVRSMASISDREELETLVGLVGRHSPSGEEDVAVEWLVDRMRALGYGEAFVDEAGNAVGVRGEGRRQIVLLGHIDTVPGEIPVRIDEERLYGRGSVDAKGPLAAFVDAAARVEPSEDWQVVVIGAVEEERDSAGARHVLGQYHPDFAVVGEPSQWDRVTLGYKGSAWSQVSVRREITHTAGQERSACELAVAVWNTASAWANSFNAGRDKAFDQVLPGLQSWESGNDGFEEWANLVLSVRLPLDLLPEEWYAQLRNLSGAAKVQAKGFPIGAYRAEKNTPLVRAFLAAIREAGGRPNFVLKTGTADLNIVAPAWGCPAVAYGPGDSALDHTPEEHVSLADYRRAVAVVQEVLQRLL